MLDVYTECRTLCVVQEGFPTHGGLEGAPWSAWRWACGTACARTGWPIASARCSTWWTGWRPSAWCASRQGPCGLRGCGQAAAPHPGGSVPAHALACELYKVAGIRAVEIGSPAAGARPATGKQHPCPAELLRLTIPVPPIPRPTWTLSSRAFGEVKKNAHRVKGLDFIYEPAVLRHFTARLKEVEHNDSSAGKTQKKLIEA